MEYSVDEEVIAGYQKEIKKNAENDYTITNKNVEEVSVKVTKTWIGPAKQVTVKLFKTVGGVKTEIQSKVLNESRQFYPSLTSPMLLADGYRFSPL